MVGAEVRKGERDGDGRASYRRLVLLDCGALDLQIVDFIRQQRGPLDGQFGNPPLACVGSSRHCCSVDAEEGCSG